jgi:hypothetical protein
VRVALLAVALASTLSACGGAAKRETASLAAAVDRYRSADGASRAARAEGIAAVVCTDARVCDTKQTCLAAIDATGRALALKDEVASRLVDIEQKRLAPDAPEAAALPGKLDEAERLLGEGRAKMASCEKGLTDLRTQYGV